MLFLGESGPFTFYMVQGGETGMVHQLISGNIPELTEDRVLLGMLAGGGLLLLALVLTAIARRAERQRRLVGRRARLLDVAIFLGFFVVWEALLGLPAFQADGAYIPDPLAFWKANPDLEAASRRAGVGLVGVAGRRPQPGIFDQDHGGPKPAGTYRIAFMGDSQLISSGPLPYAGGLTYPKVVESSLSGYGLVGPQGQPVEIINAGISGYTSWQGLMLLRSELLPLQPDLVVLAFGYHDANRALSHDHEVLTDDPWTWRIRSVIYRSRIVLLLRSLSLQLQAERNDRSLPRDQRMRVPPDRFARNLEAFAEMGRSHSFRVIFLLEPFRDARLVEQGAEHRRAMLDVAARQGIPVIDGRSLFAAIPPEKRQALFDDFIHLNRAGHAAMAELVRRRLVAIGILTASTSR